MFSAHRLAEQLAACERQIVAIRLKAEEKKAIEEERYVQVCATRDECVATHRRQVDENILDWERQMEGTVTSVEAELAALRELGAQARQREAEALAKAQAMDELARDLERQVHARSAQMDATGVENDRQYVEIQHAADDAVQRILQDTCSKVQDAFAFAMEVQGLALDTINNLQEDIRGQVDGARDKSRQRSRFEKLVLMLSAREAQAEQDLTPGQLRRAKAALLQAWLDDWVDHTNVPMIEAPSCVTTAPSTPLKPTSADWPRDKHPRHMAVASPGIPHASLTAGWGEYRPQTAP